MSGSDVRALVGSPNMAFIGKAGAGKTTAARFLVEHQGYRPLSFAGPLKQISRGIWGDGAEKDRGKLQKLGKAVRAIDQDAWVNLALKYMHDREQNQTNYVGKVVTPWVIDDCRFENEVATLRGQGFVLVRLIVPRDVQIQRLTASGKLQHESQLDDESETALDNVPGQWKFHNTEDVMELYAFILRVLSKELIAR